MFCYLIKLYRKRWVWFNYTIFNKLYSSSSVYLINFGHFSSKWNWHVRGLFLDLFSYLFSHVIFFNRVYLFCSTCETMKITLEEQRENTERKSKKSYSVAKRNLVNNYSFMASTKKVWNSDHHWLLPPYTPIQYPYPIMVRT